MQRRLALLVGLVAAALTATPAMAITNGQPDNGEHPYVGQLIFFDPTYQDSRFNDPGGWFNCSGTLLTPTIVLTAGHCTFGIGHAGTDIWFTNSEVADYVGLPPSSTFVPDGNADRYDAWKAFFDANPEWVTGTATPHPQYDDSAFFVHDLGVVVLDEPINLADYGKLPTLDYLEQFAGGPNNAERFEATGYGLEKSRINFQAGGDTRRKADVKLINLHSQPADTYAVFSADNGAAHRGGTCFGDSGGPILSDEGAEEIVVAVNSWAQNYSCAGKSGGYRVDQPDDLDWLLADFGLSAANTGD